MKQHILGFVCAVALTFTANAQTIYTIPPTGNVVTRICTDSNCTSMTTTNATLVQHIQGSSYTNLVASDGTGNCYSWAVWVFNMGLCQTTYHGGAPGEGAALYCGQETWQSPVLQPGGDTLDVMDCVASFQGTAITVINGVDTPITTNFNLHFQAYHHKVYILIHPFRGRPYVSTLEQIDPGSFVRISPVP
ncbi:exported hypothetical protein [Candidatus Sulfopaludibacter sp. SbA4]|nr:exported hypothetical protein [Candidatus Sulfopaludibacter sp. SbA4]